jgi:hypothetical protein
MSTYGYLKYVFTSDLLLLTFVDVIHDLNASYLRAKRINQGQRDYPSHRTNSEITSRLLSKVGIGRQCLLNNRSQASISR